jgi:hypothetical protein
VAEKSKIIAVHDGIEIIANREGLNGLADVCQRLAMLPEDDEQARRLGNHYHYAPWMNNTEQDSIALMILYKPDL